MGFCTYVISKVLSFEQAVAQGDAMKVDKRRKKRMREEEEQAIDPIFGGSDDDDGGDYNPEAADEPEYIEAGADQNEDADLNGTAAASDEDKGSRRRLLAGTGTKFYLPIDIERTSLLLEAL